MHALLSNQVILVAFLCWFVAQLAKIPVDYLRTHQWQWALIIQAGGMPSSHSALVTGVAYSVGLTAGFDSAVFGLSVALAGVVIYDATGIRRQAGKHAEVINAIVADLAAGHPLKEGQLREVLGHTPLQALIGTLLGILIAQITWMLRG